MATKANQLEPTSQIQAGINQLADELNAATETIRRLNWLKEKLAVQIAEMAATKESLEFYTEAEAAEILKIDPEKPARAETQLASLRRQFDFPHCKVGKKFVTRTITFTRSVRSSK
jgi:hypothetical protein